MWTWLSDTQNVMDMIIALLALVFGASARTIRVLKNKDTNIKISWQEWIHNQATALPIGLIVLLIAPTYRANIAPPFMLAVMLGVGVFSTEAFNFAKSQIPTEKGVEK